ncbi:MAG: hypothetical protein JWO48_3445 [Bryobacterales bacterium]|nr:hypothetical protein [Bryobacterales bacterium]
MALDLERSTSIWNEMRRTNQNDFLDNVIETAVRYARMRVDYFRADAERQRTIGADRTATHNALISHIDVLARVMKQNGEDAAWRERLGNDRKSIGDFACWLHALLGLGAR